MVDIHADDYALTMRTSEEMLSLMKEGALNSISIVPNMSCYEECIRLLQEAIPSLPFLPRMSVHLDLVEGICLAAKEGELDRSSQIVKEGVRGLPLIATDWKALFLGSYLPNRRRRLKEELKLEITSQVNKVWITIQRCLEIAKEYGVTCDQFGLRIDSHQHTHLIPVVREALSEVLRENANENGSVEYIRNSREPLFPFLSEGIRNRIEGRPMILSFRPVNLVKNRILFFYSGKLDTEDRKNKRDCMLLWGLIMSGEMDAERVGKLVRPLMNYAKKQGRNLEILFHPGRMAESERSEEIPEGAAEAFYLRKERELEYQAVLFLKALLESEKR